MLWCCKTRHKWVLPQRLTARKSRDVEPGEHQRPETHHQGEEQQYSWHSGCRNRYKISEISLYSYFVSCSSSKWHRLPSSGQMKDKAVESAQRWELTWREKRRFYFIISSFFVRKSAETGGLPFLSGLSQKVQFDGWLANSGFLSKCPTSLCSFVLVMTIMCVLQFFLFNICIP